MPLSRPHLQRVLFTGHPNTLPRSAARQQRMDVGTCPQDPLPYVHGVYQVNFGLWFLCDDCGGLVYHAPLLSMRPP